MAGEVVQVQLRNCVWKSWATPFNLDLTVPCSNMTSAPSVGLRSNFHGSQLAVSSGQHYHRPSNPTFRRRIGGDSPRAVSDRLSGDECGADFQWRKGTCEHFQSAEIAEIASTSVRADFGTPLSPDRSQWRDFRARLCSSKLSTSTSPEHQLDTSNIAFCRSVSEHWAHRISVPEVGCVLVAKEKLNRHAFLRESVVILLGTTGNRVQGVILNKRMPFSAQTLQGTNHRALLDLAGCRKYVGGPLLSAREINVLSKENLRGFSTVVPGLYTGGEAALSGLVSRVTSGNFSEQDLRLYVGKMEWQAEHLFAEIVVFEWWDVVACSSALLQGSSEDLWLQLRSLL